VKLRSELGLAVRSGAIRALRRNTVRRFRPVAALARPVSRCYERLRPLELPSQRRCSRRRRHSARVYRRCGATPGPHLLLAAPSAACRRSHRDLADPRVRRLAEWLPSFRRETVAHQLVDYRPADERIEGADPAAITLYCSR
jgi:hypothetical protein